MDWQNVTAEELLDALREVEWTVPPRPPNEFFAKFTPPKTLSKWQSRVKCNVYYYRANYVIILFISFAIAFYRNPYALLAVALSSLALLCLNDSFASALSDRTIRLIRKVNAPLAAKMRSAGGSFSSIPASSRRKSSGLYMIGVPRSFIVGGLASVSLIIIYLSSALTTIFAAFGISFSVILVHASCGVVTTTTRYKCPKGPMM
ncbi:hypothetical protein CYMTET_16341 [Cymbomonas tetramitiformis]|uniref:PRA1 family protein n=1 Tax=Cymbomonas tetramitiformis TaxID=36881 RepID=A0AAE0GCE7_9CHLO|nr:hypothetical protein CYMTET_16341 [Cymbomonas tetramitiformis]